MRFSDRLPDAFDHDLPDDPDAAHAPDEELDDEFPLGDGTAETGAAVVCPYCAAVVEIALDPGSGATQDYVEDCEVCCQPWRVTVAYDDEGRADVAIAALEA